jgi:hypothetical protein
MVTNYSDRRFCVSYILFIIITGGILVLFIYITRLASNEIFSPSNKIHWEVGRAKDLSAPRYKPPPTAPDPGLLLPPPPPSNYYYPVITFMHGINNYVPKTNHVSRVCIVAVFCTFKLALCVVCVQCQKWLFFAVP